MCYRAGLNGGIMTVVRRIAIFNILSIVSLISACGGSDSKNSIDPPAASGSSTSSSGSSTSSSGSSTSSSGSSTSSSGSSTSSSGSSTSSSGSSTSSSGSSTS